MSFADDEQRKRPNKSPRGYSLKGEVVRINRQETIYHHAAGYTLAFDFRHNTLSMTPTIKSARLSDPAAQSLKNKLFLLDMEHLVAAINHQMVEKSYDSFNMENIDRNEKDCTLTIKHVCKGRKKPAPARLTPAEAIHYDLNEAVGVGEQMYVQKRNSTPDYSLRLFELSLRGTQLSRDVQEEILAQFQPKPPEDTDAPKKKPSKPSRSREH